MLLQRELGLFFVLILAISAAGKDVSFSHVTFFSEEACGLLLTINGIPKDVKGIFQSHIGLENFEVTTKHGTTSEALRFDGDLELKKLGKSQIWWIKKSSREEFREEWSVSIFYFSRFYEMDELEVSLSLIDLKDITEYQLRLPLNQSILLQRLKKVVPANIEEAQKFHPNFQPIMLARNLSFYADPVDNVAHLVTIQRAGTHLVSRLLEDILGEWVSMFPFQSSKEFVNLDQLKGYPTEHCKISTSHSIIDNRNKRSSIKVNRYIFLVRDILDASDSLYHKRRLDDHEAKFSGEYWLTDDFAYFFQKLLPDFERKAHLFIDLKYPKFSVRYEDLLSDPARVIEDILSFILLFPAKHAMLPKIKEVLETQGLRSYYKTTATSPGKKEEDSESPKKKERLDFFKEEMIRDVWNKSARYLGFFMYEENFRRRLGEKTRWEKATFEDDNRIQIGKILSMPGLKKNI